jgi:hypothetical protein
MSVMGHTVKDSTKDQLILCSLHTGHILAVSERLVCSKAKEMFIRLENVSEKRAKYARYDHNAFKDCFGCCEQVVQPQHQRHLAFLNILRIFSNEAQNALHRPKQCTDMHYTS